MGDSLRLPEAIRRQIGASSLEREDIGRSEAMVFGVNGYFLKIGPRGSLNRAALMQEYFARKGLSGNVSAFIQEDGRDYLLMEAVPGANACHRIHQPELLASAMGEIARDLHEREAQDCPLRDVNELVLAAYRKETGRPFGENASLLQKDALIHGDFCLPNLMFEDDRFTGFVDLGESGLGDRHIDLYWAMWSLEYNLKSDRFNPLFLDAYGRDAVDDERMELCARICSCAEP